MSIDDRRPAARPAAIAGTCRWFVQWIDLPAGLPAGSTPYARLERSRHVPVLPGQPAPPVGLEQFDAAPADDLMYAFADGWHELEEDPATGRLWRWTSAQEHDRGARRTDDDPTSRRGVAAPSTSITRRRSSCVPAIASSRASRRPPTFSRPSPSPADALAGLGRPDHDRDRPDVLPGRAAPGRGSAKSGLKLTRIDDQVVRLQVEHQRALSCSLGL